MSAKDQLSSSMSSSGNPLGADFSFFLSSAVEKVGQRRQHYLADLMRDELAEAGGHQSEVRTQAGQWTEEVPEEWAIEDMIRGTDADYQASRITPPEHTAARTLLRQASAKPGARAMRRLSGSQDRGADDDDNAERGENTVRGQRAGLHKMRLNVDNGVSITDKIAARRRVLKGGGVLETGGEKANAATMAAASAVAASTATELLFAEETRRREWNDMWKTESTVWMAPEYIKRLEDDEGCKRASSSSFDDGSSVFSGLSGHEFPLDATMSAQTTRLSRSSLLSRNTQRRSSTASLNLPEKETLISRLSSISDLPMPPCSFSNPNSCTIGRMASMDMLTLDRSLRSKSSTQVTSSSSFSTSKSGAFSIRHHSSLNLPPDGCLSGGSTSHSRHSSVRLSASNLQIPVQLPNRAVMGALTNSTSPPESPVQHVLKAASLSRRPSFRTFLRYSDMPFNEPGLLGVEHDVAGPELDGEAADTVPTATDEEYTRAPLGGIYPLKEEERGLSRPKRVSFLGLPSNEAVQSNSDAFCSDHPPDLSRATACLPAGTVVMGHATADGSTSLFDGRTPRNCQRLLSTSGHPTGAVQHAGGPGRGHVSKPRSRSVCQVTDISDLNAPERLYPSRTSAPRTSFTILDLRAPERQRPTPPSASQSSFTMGQESPFRHHRNLLRIDTSGSALYLPSECKSSLL